MKEKRKHRIVKCYKCKCNNDIDECIDNEDFDTDNYGSYIYCKKCGQQIEIILK